MPSTFCISAFLCSCCSELLFDPVTLPCGNSVCRTCFPKLPLIPAMNSCADLLGGEIKSKPNFSQSELMEAFQSTTDPNFISPKVRSDGHLYCYACPVKSCNLSHIYRYEKTNVVLSKMLHQFFPDECKAYSMVREGEKVLKLLARKSLTTPSGKLISQQSLESLKFIQVKYIEPAVALAPHLQKARVLRSALYLAESNFQNSADEMYRIITLNPYNQALLTTLKCMSRLAQHIDHQNHSVTLSRPLDCNDLSHISELKPHVTKDDACLRDLECNLCMSVFNDPVSGPCGHTACRACLLNSLDHNNACPICRTILPSNGYFRSLSTNHSIEKLTESCSHSSEMLESSVIQPDFPIFVCSLAFPKSSYFFQLFEPRYRVLIKRCLEGNRRFGICLPQRDPLLGYSFSDYGTVVEIKNHLAHSDSDLVETEEGLLPRYDIEAFGLYRFKVKERSFNSSGYHTAVIERLYDSEPDFHTFNVDPRPESFLDPVHTTVSAFSFLEQMGSVLYSQILALAKNMSVMDTSESYYQYSSYCYAMKGVVNCIAKNTDECTMAALEEQFGKAPVHQPANLTFWLAQVLPIPDATRSMLLAINDVEERCVVVLKCVEAIRVARLQCQL